MLLFLLLACSMETTHTPVGIPVPTPQQEKSFAHTLATAAESIEDHSIVYDPAYLRIDYPLGDVPAGTGVCTDVVIRAYRKLGIDLQQYVHEDIVAHRDLYPNIKKPDTNIDHRRVPNLGTFFSRKGESLSTSTDPEKYLPGDIVWWKLGGPKGLNHIGIVVHKRSSDGKRPLVIHNIGSGQIIEDILFTHHIHKHYRYHPQQ